MSNEPNIFDFLKKIYNEMYKDKTAYTEQEFNSIKQSWTNWRNKIKAETLTLTEYTNRIKDCQEGYLTYFLERKSSLFGSIKGSRSQNFMIYKKDDGSFYNAYNGNHSTEESATGDFKEHILPLLKDICDCNGVCDNFKTIINSKDSKCKNFRSSVLLHKMMVLENVFYGEPNLLHIYKKEALEILYKELSDNPQSISDENFIEKNKDFTEMIFYKLGLTRSLKTMCEVSAMLYDYATIKDEINEDSPNVIYYGAPGTGKTYEVLKKIKFLTKNDSSRFVHIQCHPNFGYEDFIEGLKPIGITKEGSLNISVVNGIFKDFCIKASKDTKNTYYFIADELNRANLSAMFGETLSLLEPGYRDDPNGERHLVKTPLSTVIEKFNDKSNFAYYYNDVDGVKFGIPKNIRFIGMMNDVDKSIDSFDLALRRRFRWIRKDCDYDVLANFLKQKSWTDDEIDNFIDNCKNLNNYITKKLNLGKSYEIGHSYFMAILKCRKSQKVLFEQYLEPVIVEYIRGITEESEISEKIKTAKQKFGIGDNDEQE